MKGTPHPYPAVGSERGRSKGATFREFTRWVEMQYGHARLIEGWSRLPPPLQQLVNPRATALGIEASAWYPSALPNRLLDAFLAGMSLEERSRVIREGTRHALSRTFRGVYKFVFTAVMTPERLAQHIQKIWDLHYDSGIDVWTMKAPGHIETRIEGWIGHHTNTCDILRESSVVMLEMLGCHDVENRRVRCVGAGDPHCAGILTYR